jgi:hypothetical protein
MMIRAQQGARPRHGATRPRRHRSAHTHPARTTAWDRPSKTRAAGDPRYAGQRYADPRYADPRYADPRYDDQRYDDQRYDDQRYDDQRWVAFEDPRRSERGYSDDDYDRGKPKKRKKSFLEEFFD